MHFLVVKACDEADVLSDEFAKEGGEGTVEEGRNMVYIWVGNTVYGSGNDRGLRLELMAV